MSLSLAEILCKFLAVVALSVQVGAGRNSTPAGQSASDIPPAPSLRAPSETRTSQQSFLGVKAGDEREVGGVKLCWCPPGRFTMGSPPGEPERRPGEDQVEVTLTRGFWVGKYEVTQGQWRQVVGDFPGKLTAGEGDDFPVYDINFAEAEGFCRKLTEKAHAAGELPKEWEFRLPTEAQWEYACRAGTTTATSFGDRLSSKQANFQGKPYNGAEAGPSLKRAAPVGSYPANPWGIHDMHGNVFEWCRDWYHARLPGRCGPRLVFRKAHGADQSHAHCVQDTPGRLLGRRGLALPVSLPPAVRARAQERPHRLPRRRRTTLRKRRFPARTVLVVPALQDCLGRLEGIMFLARLAQ